ncbi:MAG: hypothetical protein KAY37_13140 [Phycisphaerae bacterium]|nr:hypothetical protein [Phycisphaerae bacterium]
MLAEQAAASLCAGGCSWTVLPQGFDDRVCLASVSRGGVSVERIQTWSEGHVAVAMDGYLSRDRNAVTTGNDAQLVAERYARRGPAAVEQFDGSFVLVLVDRQHESVTLWTDRPATRPCFLAVVGQTVIVAPELKCFRNLPGVRRDLVPGSLAAMSLNGALLDEHTYYRGVRLLGPARRLTISPAGIKLDRYWQRSFNPEQSEVPSAEQVADCICRATRRHLARFERPVLALSGGLDSRIILAACRRMGLRPPAITWGFDHVETPGSDFQIGRASAERAGIEHRMRRMDVDQLPRSAERVVDLTDGLTGHLGNFTEGEAVARELAADHDALVRGDEMFGWAASVSSPAVALRRVGVNVGKRLRLLRFLLQPDVAEAVLTDYRAQQQQLLDSLDPMTPPNDVKDILYWRTRFPRLIASQAAVFRAHLDVVTPFLDREVIELVRGCSAAQREHKRYIAECTRSAFPEEFSLPLNNVHSRTSWRTRLRELGPTQRFLVETLLEPLESFDRWFDRTALRAWLAAATVEGQHAAWPGPGSWLRRREAQARALLLRPTFKERVILNLVTLKLWFQQLG